MHNRYRAAARSIATPLHELEQAVDVALAKAGELASALPAARNHARVSAVVAQPAFDSLGLAFAALMQVRRHVVDTHTALDTTRLQLRLPVIAFGDESPKPNPSAGFEPDGLRVVA